MDGDELWSGRRVERPYEFRRRLAAVHRADRRDPGARAEPGELIIDERWSIAYRMADPTLVRRAALDLADYFAVSMRLPLPVGGIEPEGSTHHILLTVDADDAQLAGAPEGSYRVVIEAQSVLLIGKDDRGAAQAAYFLEDLINLRCAPYLRLQDVVRSPVFAPRMTHSGWGLDDFPDSYLAQIAHAGMQSIVVFVSGPDRVPDEHINRHPERGSQGRHQDLSALADRCAAFGLDMYLYAYFHGVDAVHPDDPGSDAYFDRTYGAVFESCPQARGIVLVGESVEFPSRDPNTSGRSHKDSDGWPQGKPSPGWWPCEDFPAWVERVRDSCRRVRPDAEIIFWTYNWGWAPEEDRLALLRNLPTDITLQATFEMFSSIEHDGVVNMCVDYTASVVGPGPYFASEAEVAHDRGIRLHAMANTGGLSWDFGCIPYQPIPQQWNRRHQALLMANSEWGLTGLMENHHYGWWPSFVSDLAKWNYWTPATDPDETLEALAQRDFGAGAAAALRAWNAWSAAADDYIPTNADQYGPFRIGPAYPLTLFTTPRLPAADHAMFGDLIVSIPYQPDQVNSGPTTANAIRIKGEIASLTRMLERWTDGENALAEAIAAAPEHRRTAAAELAGLAAYIGGCIRTTLHVKEWWLLRTRLLITDDPVAAAGILDQLDRIGRREEANVVAVLPLVRADSRLGWEPSMEYVGDEQHLTWKLAHLRHALEEELPRYRAALTLTSAD